MAREYTNIADAISAVNTEVSAQTTQIADILTALEGKSGGGLPTSISKIDGGSFTVASNTKCDAYSIAHNLGTIPKGFCVWTDDETSATAVDIYALIYSQFLTLTHDTQSGTSNSGCLMQYYRITTGKTASATRTPSATQLSGYVTNTQFKINDPAINYRAGNTYKWIAWA